MIKMLSELTAEQREIADNLQKYLAEDCAKLGNEVTQKLYLFDGYTEADYYPLKVNSNFINSSNENIPDNASYWAIKNMSFTHATVENANAPININNIVDVWAEHVGSMITYNAFTAPLQDAMKWFNFKTADDSIKLQMQETFTEAAKKYFTNLITDINGMSPRSHSTVVQQVLLKNAKSANVAFNLRVVIQQPCSYVRAAALIDAKYLTEAFVPGQFKTDMETIKEYCPIAWWKSQGFYETDIGRDLKDIITNKATKIERAREYGMKLAEIADERTWRRLWIAAAKETADKTDLTPGSKEFYKAVGLRLSQIIDETQVVDTVLHRTQIMRSKDTGVKVATAFMAEPLKSVNLFSRALISGDKKRIARAGAVLIFSNLIVAAAQSAVDAPRDDEDDEEHGTIEEYALKYIKALKGNIIDEMNPLSDIPYIRDIISAIKYANGSSLTDSYITDAINVAKYVYDLIENKDKYNSTKRRKKIYDSVYAASRALSYLTGVGVSGLVRTSKSIYNIFSDENIAKPYAFNDKCESLAKAISSRNSEAAERIHTRLLSDEYTEREIQNGIKTYLVESEPRIAQAAEARQKASFAQYEATIKALVNLGYAEDTVYGAIESKMAQGEEKEEATEPAAKQMYKTADLINAVNAGNKASAAVVVKYMKRTGKEDSAIRSQLTKELRPKYYEYFGQYRKGNAAAQSKLRAMRSTLISLNIGYSDKVFIEWNEGYSDWLKEQAEKQKQK